TLKTLPAETPDGRRVALYANIGLIADLQFAHRHGAEGIGLHRTEFPFLTYREFPDEEEQFQLYARVVRGMEGRPVTIRTLEDGAPPRGQQLRPERAGRDDGRGAFGRDARAPADPRGGLLLDRDQRPDPVPARRRSRQRQGRSALRAAPPRGPERGPRGGAGG